MERRRPPGRRDGLQDRPQHPDDRGREVDRHGSRTARSSSTRSSSRSASSTRARRAAWVPDKPPMSGARHHSGHAQVRPDRRRRAPRRCCRRRCARCPLPRRRRRALTRANPRPYRSPPRAATGRVARPRPSRSVGHEGHARVGVGPGLPGAMLLGSRAGLLGMNPFPIVGARIHPPLLRADTLSRERLNAWLDEAATGRVALVVAEAGFGKTTFLGDWARNSAASHGLVSARSRRSRLADVQPASRRGGPRARSRVRAGHLRPADAARARRSDAGRHRGEPRPRVRGVRRGAPARTDADLRRLPRRRRQRRGRARSSAR